MPRPHGHRLASRLHRIVHFDLKSANVLLGRDWTAKIADVGLAKILKDGWLSTLREVCTLILAPICCERMVHVMSLQATPSYPTACTLLKEYLLQRSWLCDM